MSHHEQITGSSQSQPFERKQLFQGIFQMNSKSQGQIGYFLADEWLCGGLLSSYGDFDLKACLISVKMHLHAQCKNWTRLKQIKLSQVMPIHTNRVKHRMKGNWLVYFIVRMATSSLQTREQGKREISRVRTERIVENLEPTCRYLLTKWVALRKD